MNKKASFTPGPWRVFEPIARDEELDIEIYNSGDEYIGAVANEQGIDKAMANAAIVSAAPDMLAALKKAANIIQNEWGHCLDEGSMDGVPADIRAAIAKAEGKEVA